MYFFPVASTSRRSNVVANAWASGAIVIVVMSRCPPLLGRRRRIGRSGVLGSSGEAAPMSAPAPMAPILSGGRPIITPGLGLANDSRAVLRTPPPLSTSPNLRVTVGTVENVSSVHAATRHWTIRPQNRPTLVPTTSVGFAGIAARPFGTSYRQPARPTSTRQG